MNGKEFIDIIRSRRSVRKFKSCDIPQELLAEIIETAATAPSAGNRRDWEFSAIISQEIKQQMLNATRDAWDNALACCETEIIRNELEQYRGNFEWFASAPALVAISCKLPPLFMEQMFKQAAGNIAGSSASAFMAAENLLLAAHGYGMGGCCLTGPLAAANAFRQLLKLERRREIVCIVALGYPADNSDLPPNRTKSTMRII